ncbi:ORC6-like protein [Mya arenaria]|uniref:ORC6-like protein n=1 Tax=Mya arenaria TaxID=6604 RepID=A0ABY7EW17_MYAAR|nr:origin recognition complex subunit 6-like [Mya arenaria]WAR11381.1 ORC6-like protein [Mya arenaria]
MCDLQTFSQKIGVTSPRVIRKAKEYSQLVDIRSSNASLAALKLTGACKTLACIDLAASMLNHYVDKASVVRVSGTTKQQYLVCLKTIESILEVQRVTTVRDLAVQFGCPGVVDLAQRILQKYSASKQVGGDDMDFNTSLFQGAALCAACRKQKMKVDRGKFKELCAVKRSCFDTLTTEMEKIADSLEGEKKSTTKKRGSTLLDEIERQAQDMPEKKPRADDEEEEVERRIDFEEWKRKILENAAKANS